MTSRRAIAALFCAVLATAGARAWGAGIEDERPQQERGEVWKGIMSSFDLPFGDLLKESADATPEHPLSVSVGLDYPLQSNVSAQSGLQSQGANTLTSPTAVVNLRYNPLSYWFFNFTARRYFLPDRQQPWNPDFTYAFGYDDWHPYTLSLIYGNYGGNRFSPDYGRGEARTRFNQGTLSYAFKFPMPKLLEPLFLIDEKDQVNCSVGANVTPRYTDLKTLSLKAYKKSLALGCRYTTPENWYANITLFYFPNREQQQPWDPDFTYGFGYFDWHPGTISVQYNNYSGNRFPGRETAPGQGGFRNGSISITWSIPW
ncbi:hypothetical protein SAMN06265795_102272 [Noviherbaspirillum humi]|uniref:Uncharacterized protein n=2 Tax=Noviherbaspirillum humi TaxID=1688639 RepID=A0A239DMU7_9BURK|nr:hypothetical protein SAMN06265795_102272 [Noviherbaspirillum humi]